jgi:hypothetical protein
MTLLLLQSPSGSFARRDQGYAPKLKGVGPVTGRCSILQAAAAAQNAQLCGGLGLATGDGSDGEGDASKDDQSTRSRSLRRRSAEIIRRTTDSWLGRSLGNRSLSPPRSSR